SMSNLIIYQLTCGLCFLFFFFSSRRRHTRWPRDWSSDVCSSDLHLAVAFDAEKLHSAECGVWNAECLTPTPRLCVRARPIRERWDEIGVARAGGCQTRSPALHPRSPRTPPPPCSRGCRRAPTRQRGRRAWRGGRRRATQGGGWSP